ncbi:unnamed protein product [Rhizoctonia solani]|uniref:F-box domain-containing protein n=1 Tax=Rhizoctonia solani TaxID=456999 RepID=A0A8H3E9P6_9AGAM|nr:unnamed protein product [Rhizoctonia solani]
MSNMSLLPIRFPNELLTMVIAQLSTHNLVPVSLVCRRWQRLAFPFLYHSMYLSKCTHLEALENRLLEDNVPDSLSVPAHLKCLAFGGSDINYINPEYFELILPRLVHLTSLSWELPYTPRHFGPFVDCPKLKAVHLEPLHMWGDDEWIERLPQ